MASAKGTVETGYVSSDLNLLPTKLRAPHDCPCVQAILGLTLAPTKDTAVSTGPAS